MSRLRVLYVYSTSGPLNQRTLNVPVRGFTLRVHTDWETEGEQVLMLIMWFVWYVPIISTGSGGLGSVVDRCYSVTLRQHTAR